MKQFLIGRKSPADIIPTGPKQETVSAGHALMEQTDTPGIWLLTDLGSSNGTYVQTENGWVRLQARLTAKVNDKTRLRFGFLETTLAELLNRKTLIPQNTGIPQPPANGSNGTYMRNPLTGEIQFIPGNGM